ncbi:MAG: hypothetical protein QOC61_1554, partial [Acidobacteriota bacterium]|nr:hypothetical protein [Acidobacteriota bacterium]
MKLSTRITLRAALFALAFAASVLPLSTSAQQEQQERQRKATRATSNATP